MKSRVEGLVGDVATRIWLSTFHSFCAKFLRFELDNFLGYNSNFTIYDTSDSQAVIKAALKALNLDDKYYPVGAMIGAISDAKNKLLPQILESKRETFTNKRLLMYMSIMNGNCVRIML